MIQAIKWRMVWVLAAMLVVAPVWVFAQTITASVSKNPVSVDDNFELRYTINGSSTRFKPPSLSEFNVLSGPNQSQSIQFINGATTQSLSFSYILQPKKEGTFTIAPGKIEAGGKEIASQPLTITVVKGQGGQSNQQGGNDDEKTKISAKNIFIRVSVDKSNVYQGEAIVATYKLYTNVPLLNYTISKAPSLNGFWSTDLELPKQMQLNNEVVNGVNYSVGEIKKVVLIPQQSGTLTLDPMEGEVTAQIQVKRSKSNNPFDLFNDPFFNDPFLGAGGIRNVRYAIKSDPIKINVKPLPPDPPSSFKGAVGKFAMEASVDKLSPKTNDAVTLKIKITGKGNLKLLDAPDFHIPEDIETYDPKTTDNITFSSGGSSGSRVFEYLMIPRVPGKYELGEAEFTYFDPSKRSYVTLKKGPFALDVAKGADGGVAVTGSGKSDFKILGRDIRYIKVTPPDFGSAGIGFTGSLLFWILVLLPVATLIFVMIYYRKRLEEISNAGLFRAKRAGSVAVKRLSVAKKKLDQGDTSAFYTETYKALYDYAAHKLGIPVAELTRDSVAARFAQKNTPQELVKELEMLIDQCELSRFAAVGMASEPAVFYKNAVELITRIENA